MTPREHKIAHKAVKETILNIFASMGDYSYPYYILGSAGVIAFQHEFDLDKFINRIDLEDDVFFIASAIREKISQSAIFVNNGDIIRMYSDTLTKLENQYRNLSDDGVRDLGDALDL